MDWKCFKFFFVFLFFCLQISFCLILSSGFSHLCTRHINNQCFVVSKWILDIIVDATYIIWDHYSLLNCDIVRKPLGFLIVLRKHWKRNLASNGLIFIVVALSENRKKVERFIKFYLRDVCYSYIEQNYIHSFWK